MIIGICGKSGSGKTTLASHLAKEYENAINLDIDKIGHNVLNIEEVKCEFIKLLNTDSDIDINAHFILDLGATSLDYLTLLVKLEEKYEIKFDTSKEPCYSVIQFVNYIISQIK